MKPTIPKAEPSGYSAVPIDIGIILTLGPKTEILYLPRPELRKRNSDLPQGEV
ncbi:MAG: hypothetical protein R2814_01685 [Flavobacteriaceae bacterium]